MDIAKTLAVFESSVQQPGVIVAKCPTTQRWVVVPMGTFNNEHIYCDACKSNHRVVFNANNTPRLK